MSERLDPAVLTFLTQLNAVYARNVPGKHLIPETTLAGWKEAKPRASSLAAVCKQIGLAPDDWLLGPLAAEVDELLTEGALPDQPPWLEEWLEQNSGALPTAGPALVKSKSVPPAPLHFVRRRGLERRLFDLLKRAARKAADGDGPQVMAVYGSPGAGKTATTARLLHDARLDRLFHRVLWMRVGTALGGMTAATRLAALKNQYLPWWAVVKRDGEGDAGFREAGSEEHLRAMLNGHLASDLSLQVFDDVYDAADVSRLRLGSPREVILITTRFPVVAEEAPDDGSREWVRGMTPDEAVELFCQHAKKAHTECPGHVDRLLERVAYLPLATVVAAKQCGQVLRRRPDEGALGKVIDDLTAAGLMGEPAPPDRRAEGAERAEEDEKLVRGLLLRSYRALGKAAQGAFCAFGNLLDDDPNAPVPDDVILGMLGPPGAARAAINELLDYGLIDEVVAPQGRPPEYKFHPLQAALAVELSTQKG